MQFIKLKFKNLINAEFYQLLFLILDIIDKLDASKLKVTSRRNQFASVIARLLTALSRDKDTTITRDLNTLEKERSIAYVGLNLFVKGCVKKPDIIIKTQAIVIRNYLKLLGTNFINKNQQEKSALLTKLVQDFTNNTSLINANAIINVQDFINEIDDKNNAFIQKYEARNANESINNNTVETFVSIRPAAVASLVSLQKLLLGRYETNIEDKVDNTEIVTAIKQINQIIAKYKQLIKSSVPKKSKKEVKIVGE